MTQIISNAIIDFYNGGKQRYELPLRVPETVILNKRNNLQFLYYVFYAAILVGKESYSKFEEYYEIFKRGQLFTDELLQRTDFNGDTLAFVYFRVFQKDIPLLLRTAYMAEYKNAYTQETWPPYKQHHLKYLDVNHLAPKIVMLSNTVCEICMGEDTEPTEFIKSACGHHIHFACYKLLSAEQQAECPVCKLNHWVEKEIIDK